MMQRAAILSELPQLLRDLGVENVQSVFDSSGIDAAAITPDLRLPLEISLKILNKAAEDTNCPHLGLLLGLRFTMATHGPIGQLMLNAPFLQQALDDFVTWQAGYSSDAIVYLHRFGDDFAFGYGTYAASYPGSRILYDTVIGVSVKMIQQLTNGSTSPLEVHFAYRKPINVSEYTKLLKLPVRFDQYQTCLILDAQAMRTPLPNADLEAQKKALADIERAMLMTQLGFSNLTQRMVRSLLYLKKPSLSEVASAMNLHHRTLERRLAKEGQTFTALRNEVRFSVARELLEMTEIPISEIGEILGFEFSSGFTGAFKRVSGTSPSNWRTIRRQNF